MPKKINYKRKPNEANLAGLMVVSSDDVWDVERQTWKKGVYGAVSKDVPFISTTVTTRAGIRRRKFVNDVTELPNVAKERVMAFFDDKANTSRSKCYLVEKSLYEEIQRNKRSK